MKFLQYFYDVQYLVFACTCTEQNATLLQNHLLLLGVFTKQLQVVTIDSIVSVWLHGTEWLPQDGFSWNYIFEILTKICWHI